MTTAATWPSYAKVLADGYTEEPAAGVIRTPMESGPPKQARVLSKAPLIRNVRILLTTAEYAQWKIWFIRIIERTGWFSWTDPVDNKVKTARIYGGQYKMDARVIQGEISQTILTVQLETLE